MSSSRAKKVKMATKSCPECDQQVPVACKSCPCGYIFISRKLLHAKRSERSPPITELVQSLGSHPFVIIFAPGQLILLLRKKQEKEVDMYANLSDEKAFVFSVALAEINRKIINQRLIL
ncbi:hypothetical protein BTVI_86813 [Pitangus sulphuratus]|nr:hypothetical protein BTVI_86813 [Pitangus sulphuratus]